jgi:hypothetical protein
VGATTCHGRPVTVMSSRASPGNNGKNASGFCCTSPSAPTGSWVGYPFSAICRYQEQSHIRPVYCVYDGEAGVHRFSAWLRATTRKTTALTARVPR